MKLVSILSIIYVFSLVIVQSTTIDFSNSGTGYTVSGNVVTITSAGSYDLAGTVTDKNIVVSASCTLNLNSLSLTNSGSLTPILISSSQTVTMSLSGSSTLVDSSTNSNDGTIYLQSGASLTISGTGTLNITPNKLMAINGTDSTSLTVNDGPTINIQSSSTNAGGVYLRTAVTFNNAKFTYSGSNGENHAIDSEGTVKIVKGTYTLTAGSGKGIQSENYLIIGEENGSDSDLTLTINTSNEGIEAKKIEIYSGTISITAEEDGINAASSGTDCDETVQCSGNCSCYIIYKGGSLTLTSGEDGLDANGDITITGGEISIFASTDGADQPIDQDGLLSITGGTVLAAGSTQMGGVSAETTQIAKTYTGTINQGVTLVAKDSSNNEIIKITTPKAANYLYFNHKSTFSLTIDGTEVTLSDPSQNQGGPGGSGGQGGPGGKGGPSGQMPPEWGGQGAPGENIQSSGTGNSESSGFYLTNLNFIILIIGLFNF